MDLLIGFVVGLILGLGGMASAVKRAKKKPEGKTAKALALIL